MNISPKQLHLDCIPKETQRAFRACIDLPLFQRSKWYLAGGTALALQVGHRESHDLDFFTTQNVIQLTEVEKKLLVTKKWTTTLRDEGTLYGLFYGAKMSCIAYPFFHPSKKHLQCGTVRILLPEDIAVMKIIAISQRGKKRDFFDLYWYCHNRNDSLLNVLYRTLDRYPNQKHNVTHFVKSLIYFHDAEDDPEPQIYFSATWTQVKSYFSREIPKLTKQIMNLDE